MYVFVTYSTNMSNLWNKLLDVFRTPLTYCGLRNTKDKFLYLDICTSQLILWIISNYIFLSVTPCKFTNISKLKIVTFFWAWTYDLRITSRVCYQCCHTVLLINVSYWWNVFLKAVRFISYIYVRDVWFYKWTDMSPK